MIKYFKIQKITLIRSFYRSICLRSGLDISIDSEIGSGLKLPHPIGIVIGKGVIIGKNVTIYQNVTLGCNVGSTTPTYPKIPNNCIIGVASIIIGDVKTRPGFLFKANTLYK